MRFLRMRLQDLLCAEETNFVDARKALALGLLFRTIGNG